MLNVHECEQADTVEGHSHAIRSLRSASAEHDKEIGGIAREISDLKILVGRPPWIDKDGREHGASGLYAAIARAADSGLESYQRSIPPGASPEDTLVGVQSPVYALARIRKEKLRGTICAIGFVLASIFEVVTQLMKAYGK